ncbi:hypothetical protein EDI_334990 [Entamoeba dispar SAW760]|uniref:Protein kinase domain-containing protein n=1 Tax=Entamoeba dispar (strain ATCC PRA-260 / SAW760) TaxID=370354 RepID=B0ESY0_ENTDS|nr:uncharacterized protein EDI_334990 [Entamoeba dispar SAW760]EDR22343.1 hypothetical protein EDI_334990 [Entamoeba dispar SAW760]|eukprot:EDR22343.1 hypothetical protein EDI_334990 [Entamoeba dispar SAW760]
MTDQWPSIIASDNVVKNIGRVIGIGNHSIVCMLDNQTIKIRLFNQQSITEYEKWNRITKLLKNQTTSFLPLLRTVSFINENDLLLVDDTKRNQEVILSSQTNGDNISFILLKKGKYIGFISENSGKTVSQIKQLSYNDLLQVIFQLLWSLNIAEESFGYSHGDIHSKNILLKREPNILIDRSHNRRYLFNLKVTLIDFELSSFKYPDSTTDCIGIKNIINYCSLFQQTSQQKRLLSQFKRSLCSSKYSYSTLLQHPIFSSIYSTSFTV